MAAEAPSASSGGPWLVLGLGNPGADYARTRHNAGAMVVDLLAERVGVRLKAHRSRTEIAETRIDGVRVVLGRPRAYMNESGGPAAGLLSFFRIPPAQLLVVHDEIDLPFGRIQVRFDGGDAGHNGLRSIRRSIGTGDFFRIRLGVGRPAGRKAAADHVLREFSSTERKELPFLVDRGAEAVSLLLTGGLEVAQNAVHGDPEPC
ncbi:MAG: aminoacyl-tRNA hydrolase [Actinomycetes bacterium]